MLLAAWGSDRLQHRYGFILLGAVLSTLGYSILLAQQHHYAALSASTKYAAVFLAAMGGYIGTPIALAWLANNLAGHWKRAFGASTQVSIGNVAGIIGSNIFLAKEAPNYPTGYGVALAFMWLGFICCAIMAFLMWKENKKRDAGGRDDRLSLPEEERNNLGDDHPSFRYSL